MPWPTGCMHALQVLIATRSNAPFLKVLFESVAYFIERGGDLVAGFFFVIAFIFFFKATISRYIIRRIHCFLFPFQVSSGVYFLLLLAVLVVGIVGLSLP